MPANTKLVEVIAPLIAAPLIAQRVSSAVTAALGEERARELHARGAGMDWDQAVACTLIQTTEALRELPSQTQA